MIRKLVLPLGGLGKRLRPLTYTTPKNLLEVAGKPLIEYTLKETAAAGIREAILVISPEHKSQFEAYAKSVQEKFPHLKFHIRVQENPWGNGHAVLQAADLLGDEPFLVRFPDDVLYTEESVLAKLVKAADEHNATVILLTRIPREDVSRYGVVEVEEFKASENLHRVKGVVEKPSVEEAPSNLIIVGAYAMAPQVLRDLQILAKTMPEKDDALLLTDAFGEELKRGERILGLEFKGKRLDCGTLEGYKDSSEFLAQKGI